MELNRHKSAPNEWVDVVKLLGELLDQVAPLGILSQCSLDQIQALFELFDDLCSVCSRKRLFVPGSDVDLKQLQLVKL